MDLPREKSHLKIRRWLQPGEWRTRLLGLTQSKDTASAPGLVLIQIDGFSKQELERALQNKEMPFCQHLLAKEQYRLYPHYPSLPSATPAVQGELFYGVPQCVPAFFFFDRITGKPIRMSSGEDIQNIEQYLASQGPGLLEGGSSYANIYSGGATESHFCAISLGWNKVWKDINPLNFILLGLTHLGALLRMIWLTFLELVLAIGDCIYGMSKGENFKNELRFIPIRAAICVLLRELVSLGARIDLARGLPVVHVNFLGYDELSHHRGPSSQTAHWSLRGIDQSIASIYQSSVQATRRHYDVWIYSDHGQEETVPYPPKQGRSINTAIEEVYSRLTGQKFLPQDHSFGREKAGQRARYLGGIFQRLFTAQEPAEAEHKDIITVAKGGIGHIYLENKLNQEQKNIFARELAASAKVPLILAAEETNSLRAWTEQGEYLLPEQAPELLGQDHPYLDRVTADLISLCHHPKAGDFIICGLKADGSYDNFVFERGDHGGPGIHETDAFAMLPAGMPILSPDRTYLLTKDLRRAALHTLRRSDAKHEVNGPTSRAVPKTIRLMTYNVRSCIGTDGKISAERVARVISRYEPDIVALQELDLSRPRTGDEDQPHIIAKHLEMLYHFHPSMQTEEEQFGNAILSRWPMQIKKAEKLPALSKRKFLEPRGALWAEITIGSRSLHFITTHLSLFHPERIKQMEALLGVHWLCHPQCHGPVVLCGDFNASPRSAVYQKTKKILHDAQEQMSRRRSQPTWPSHYPLIRLDYIFTGRGVHVTDVQVPQNSFTKIVSDHLPLIADISI